MTTDLSFATNSLVVYSYEPFSYTISNPIGGSSTLSTAKTSGIPASYLTNNANVSVTFATTSNGMTPGTQQFTVSVLDPSLTTLAASTNNVTISPGRFLDGSGNSFVGSNYTFYAKEAITPIKMVAPFNIGTPTSTPSLPPGMGFSPVVGNTFNIIGTPLVTATQSNYLIIGKEVGSSKTVSSTIPFVISNERIQTNITGGGLIQGMQIGIPITPLTLTSRGNGTIRYTWSPLPDGLVMTDSSGNVQPYSTYGFIPTDPSYTMIIAGTPTLTAANAFRNAGYSNGVTQSILVERVNPLPVISSLVPVTFAFAETVLFDTASNPTLYTNVPLDPSATYYRAATYFTSNVGIANIFSPNLRSDLSLAFNGTDRAYLTGTPTSAGTASYTIRAINSNTTSRDTTSTISVVDDFVIFSTPPTPVVDTCYNFVLSRPVDVSLNGYYPSPIQFSASAASGRTINWSAPALSGTGLSLSAATGNTVSLVGTPSNISALQTLAVTASVSSASATRNVKFAVINDVFTFASVGTLSFIQNKAITPVQFSATALSGRQVTSYSATGLPLGLSLSSTGRLSGTPAGSGSGSFTVTASTGFTSGGQSFNYTITPDTILLIPSLEQQALTFGSPILPVTISGLTYSGASISNFVFSNLFPTYGLTLDASTGILNGTFTTSIPPQDVLSSNVFFYINASSGNLTGGALQSLISTNNPILKGYYVIKGNYFLEVTPSACNVNSYNFTSVLSVPTAIISDYAFRIVNLSGTTNYTVVTGTSNYKTNNGSYTFPTVTNPLFPIGPTNVSPGARRITYGPTSNTMYGVGMRTISHPTTPYTPVAFFKSTDESASWTTTFPITSSNIPTTDPRLPNVFLSDQAIAYKSNTILIGGGYYYPPTTTLSPTVIYTKNEGTTWNVSSNALQAWTADFSVDADRWIVVGSDYYLPLSNSPAQSWDGTSSRSIRYSDDQGSNWSLVTSGDFNTIGQHITYGNGVWIAGGVHHTSGLDIIAFRSSTDGLVWNTFTLNFIGSPVPSSPPVSDWTIISISFDGVNYTIVLTESPPPYTSTSYYIFDHPADGSALTSGWILAQNNLDVQPAGSVSKLRGPTILQPQNPSLDISPALSFQGGGNAVITSPTQRTFLLPQYVPITPIQFSATGTGTVYFFLLSQQLPPGLSFDQTTNQITGTPAETGQYSVTVYAKDDIGAKIFTLGFNVILASYTRQQSSAGAWTSLVRQYTEVNAATTARDNKGTPEIEYRLGEFTSPYPPSVITAVNKCSSNC